MSLPQVLPVDAPCPCGGPAYAACCGRYHNPGGPLHLLAPSAEELMRSRYSAHVLRLAGYLQDTWHPQTRPAEPAHFEPGLQWLGLEVRRHRMHDADHAEVEFIARSKLAGRAHRLHETSRFERIDGRWFYRYGALR